MDKLSRSFIEYVGRISVRVVTMTGSVVRSVYHVAAYLFAFNPNHSRKEVTELYPDPVSSRTADDLPPRSRGFIKNDPDVCTGCLDCAKICPVDCILIESEKIETMQKEWITVFDVDQLKCIRCGLCVEVCPSGSLTHTRSYEGAVYGLNQLVQHFGKGEPPRKGTAEW